MDNSRNPVPNTALRLASFWLPVGLAITISALVRWRLLDVPLERDEGEFAYMAQQWLRGVPPYVSGCTMKLPGIYVAYALVLAVGGESIKAVHGGLAVVNGLTIALVALLGRRLYGPLVGGLAAIAFACLTLSPGVQGSSGQAEHYVLLPALAGWLVLVWTLPSADVGEDGGIGAPREDRLSIFRLLVGAAVSGLLLGTGIAVKQHGALLALAAGIYLAVSLVRRSREQPIRHWLALPLFCVTAAAPTVALASWFAAHGLFKEFWFWTVDVARQYAVGGLGDRLFEILFATVGGLVRESPVLWAIALLGLSSLLWDVQNRRRALVPILLLIGGGASVFAGGAFYGHYFVLMLPAVALFVALGAQAVTRRFTQTLAARTTYALCIVLYGVATFAFIESDYVFTATPDEVSHRLYLGNLFPEAVRIAEHINQFASQGDRVAVMGSEPEIYFYVGQQAATSQIYMYPLMSGMPFAIDLQRRLEAEVEAVRPEWIVYLKENTSWGAWRGSNLGLLDWFAKYRDRHYRIDLWADVQALDHTEYVSMPEAESYIPHSNLWIALYRRRPDSDTAEGK